MNTLPESIQFAYLDYYNNYLSVELYAEMNGLEIEEARALIQIGHKVHERLVTESKKESGQ